MYTPHTVTVYNVVREPDPATLKDVTNLYVTVLDGVFCEAAKGVNVRKSGLEGADAVNLYIPFTVKAVDGFSGKPKTYTEPQAFLPQATGRAYGRYPPPAMVAIHFSSKANL